MRPAALARSRRVLGAGSAAIPSRSRRRAATPRSSRTACCGSRRRACGWRTLWSATCSCRCSSTPCCRASRPMRADPVGGAVVAGGSTPSGLRPSIETTLHALLPHRFVVHTHSVRTIALAIRSDGEARSRRAAGGLRWAWVPYRKPGLPLTRAVAERIGGGAVEVLVLGNHGLVVGGGSVDEAAALLAEVERRLDAPAQPRPGPPAAGSGRAAASLGLRQPAHERIHALATDPTRLGWATAGSLYPDHVIFLGPAAAALDDGGDGTAALARGSKLLLVPGRGALLAGVTEASADELALCLALVLERVPSARRCAILPPRTRRSCSTGTPRSTARASPAPAAASSPRPRLAHSEPDHAASPRRHPDRRRRRLRPAEPRRRGGHARPLPGRPARACSSPTSPPMAAGSSRPWATGCWSSSPASSTRCAAPSTIQRAKAERERRRAGGPPAGLSHRHQSRRRDRRGRRHPGRRRQHRGPAGGLAEPGGIAISGTAYDQVEKRSSRSATRSSASSRSRTSTSRCGSIGC